MAFFSRTPVFKRTAIYIGEMSLDELVLAAPLMLPLSTTACVVYQQLARRGAAAYGDAPEQFWGAGNLKY